MRDKRFRQYFNRRWYEWGFGIDDTQFVGPLSGPGTKDLESDQLIGLRAANGDKLWEQDVIEFCTFDFVGYRGVIVWDEFCYSVETTDSKAPVLYLLDDVIKFDSIVKIGNARTNPELIKEED